MPDNAAASRGDRPGCLRMEKYSTKRFLSVSVC
jgi:hypothetical protein